MLIGTVNLTFEHILMRTFLTDGSFEPAVDFIS